MTIEKINILESLREERFHSSIILTYSFDQLFYETVIYKELRSSGSLNNIVLLDYRFYEENILKNATQILLSGKYYTLLPVHSDSLFHPKLICLFGERYISILIGSGNLGTAGYSLNDEVFFKFKFDVSEEKFHNFCSRIWSFIKQFISVPDNSFPKKQITSIENEYKWLSKKAGTSRVYIDSDQFITFIHHTDQTILNQFIDLLSNDKIEDLYIISPFFDKQSQALKELEKMTQAKNINVAVQPETVSLNYKTIPQSIKYNYYKYSSDNRYLHAKIYLANGKKQSHILIGSANCSNQGLGTNITKKTNVEACIYSRITDSNYFTSSLGLSKIFSKNNKLNRDALKKITFKEEMHDRKSAGIKLLYLEYNHGNFNAYIDNNNQINKYTLALEGSSSKETVKLKSYLVKRNHVSFKAHDIDFNTYFTGYLISPDNKISNRVLISYYQLLEENAPSPRATQFYEIIEKINLEDSDFTDLIAPFEKLIFYTPSKSTGFNFRKKNIKEEESDKDTASAEYISYEEFLNKSRTFNNKKNINSLNNNSSIVLLMDFLLSKIGIFKPGKNLLNQQTESFDPKLYEEEKIDDFLWTKPDKYYSYSKKKHIKTIDHSEAKYLKSKTLHLAKRYISYLNQIIKGIPTKKLIAPKYLDAIELTKFFSISLLMNYFAGKEYKIGKDVIEVLELDGSEDKSYWNLILNIIARVFCYQDTKFNHQCVLKKLRIERNVNNLSEDFIAALSLAAFNICFIWEYFREEEWPELEILAFKFYLNTQIYMEHLDQHKIKFHFEKFYENSGFKDKRDTLTQKHIIKLSDIIKRYEILSDRVSKMAAKLEGIEDHFLNGRGKFPIITQPCSVWNPRFGLTYAYEVNPPSVYLNEWGCEEEDLGFSSSFVIKVDIDS